MEVLLIHSKTVGGKIFICVNGFGVYKDRKGKSVKLSKGSVVHIKPGVTHFFGSTKNTTCSLIAINLPVEDQTID